MSEKTLADLIAKASEVFIYNNRLCKGRFYWQTSCSALSVSKRDIDQVCKFIVNQAEHHKKQTFVEDLDRFLKFFNIPYLENKGIRVV